MKTDKKLSIISSVILFISMSAFSSQNQTHTTEVKTIMGRPTFLVDGNPFTAPLFATYVPTQYYYKQMAEFGCKVFNFQTNCSACDIGFSTPTWKDPNTWDFSQIDERAGNILAADPNAMMLPRIYIGTPKWWYEKYPEEMIVLDHGGITYNEPYNAVFNMKRPYPSLASEKWRSDMAMALKKTVEHIMNSPYGKNIFGFEIAALGSEEWYHMTVNQRQLGDYNPAMKKAFQKWLKEKYSTKELLQKSWNKEGLDFADVNIPSKDERIGNEDYTFRNPSKEMNVIDFYQFYSDIIADTIDYFANVVKETTNRQKVVGAFYNYSYEFRGGSEFGHNGGGRIMRSKNIDFVCAPPSYYERQLGTGAECYRRPFLPGTLHNKLWFHDNDLATFLFAKVNKSMDPGTLKRHMEILAVTPTAQESIWLFQRSAGFALAEGIYESFFDLHGGYFDHPKLLYALKQISQAIDRGKNIDRSSISEILILADEPSLAYCSFQSDYPDKPNKNKINQSLLDHQIGFIKSGAAFDSGLLSDIDLIDFNKYKMVVFLNTYNVDAAARKKIDEKIKKNNKLVVWCYAPGLFEESKKSAALMKELTGINIAESEDETFIEPLVNLTQHGIDLMKKQNETPLEKPFGMKGKICKLFYADDSNSIVLATHADSTKPAMAIKKFDSFTSVYVLNPVMPAELIRTLAKTAGVHIFSESNDTLYANKSYISINAAKAGNKIISLPYNSKVYNALTEELFFDNVNKFDISLMSGETQVLRYEPITSNK